MVVSALIIKGAAISGYIFCQKEGPTQSVEKIMTAGRF
jgi:hypothetical protein